MWYILIPVYFLLVPALSYNQSDDNPNVDYASRQLFDFGQTHKVPIGILTTSSGRPVGSKDTSTINSDLITNQFFMDSITHLANQKIPPRVAVAKGAGAFGYFKVTNDITEYTNAKLFSKVGKRTPLVSRLGVSQVGTSGSDFFTLALRSMSIKFYTEDGNFDLLCVPGPVFLTRDPADFPDLVHVFDTNPKHNMKDISQTLDFLTLKPNAIHAVLWAASEYGLPRGYRHMNAFPIHTFRLYNEQGDVSYVRFKILTTLGYQSFNLEEAKNLSATDPDFFTRDLYNSIERKIFPTWRLEMDVLTKNIDDLDFDPFDVTRLWRNGSFQIIEIGRIVLNKNVDNHFAQVEQAAFNPSNLIPGIGAPLDILFKGRVMAYTETQIHRLGINRNNIEVNCPMNVKSYEYNRNGVPPVLDNMKDAPNYIPNSFNGPVPANITKLGQVAILESSAIDLEPARNFYNNVLVTDKQKKRLVDNLVMLTVRVPEPVIAKFNTRLFEIDADLGDRFKKSHELAVETLRLPSVVEDVPNDHENQNSQCNIYADYY